jgi:hypothetical protein
MNSHHLKKKLVTSAVGVTTTVAASALLMLGAGTAHALPNYGFNSPDGKLFVHYARTAGGLTAVIADFGNPPGQTERCHYHSVGTGATPAIPFDADAFPNGAIMPHCLSRASSSGEPGKSP